MESLNEPSNSVVQTFSFISNKANSDKSSNSFKNVETEVITAEKSAPKLIFLNETTNLNLRDRLSIHLESFRSRFQKHSEDIKLFFKEIIKPRLLPLLFLVEVILSNLIMVLSAPVILLWIILILLTRQVVSFYLKSRYKNKYTLMDGADAAWGCKWYANDNSFMSLYIIEGECSLDKIRKRILTHLINRTEPGEGQSVKYTYEKMRAKIVQKCGFFCWEKCPGFDITDHIKFARNDPTLQMNEQDVFNEMQSWIDTPLDENLPQWEIVVVPKFIYSEDEIAPIKTRKSYYGLIWRINHSIMDGISAVSALQYFIADNPVKMTIDPLKCNSGPWYFQLLIYFQILLLGSRTFIKTMISHDSNCFHGPDLTGPKHLMWSRPINCQTLRQVKNTLDTSTTAILLSAIGGSLKNLAMRKNLPVPDSVIGGATCAVLPYKNIGPMNRFTVASFNLKVDVDCPQERLKSASESVKQLASGSEILKNFNMIRLSGLNPVKWIEKLMNNLQATFLLSNVPGPMECYSIFGDKLVDITAWNTIKGRTAMGICLLSYGGKIRTGYVVDSAILPISSDTRYLAEDFENEIIKLANICGIPEQLVFQKNI